MYSRHFALLLSVPSLENQTWGLWGTSYFSRVYCFGSQVVRLGNTPVSLEHLHFCPACYNSPVKGALDFTCKWNAELWRQRDDTMQAWSALTDMSKDGNIKEPFAFHGNPMRALKVLEKNRRNEGTRKQTSSFLKGQGPVFANTLSPGEERKNKTKDKIRKFKTAGTVDLCN